MSLVRPFFTFYSMYFRLIVDASSTRNEDTSQDRAQSRNVVVVIVEVRKVRRVRLV